MPVPTRAKRPCTSSARCVRAGSAPRAAFTPSSRAATGLPMAGPRHRPVQAQQLSNGLRQLTMLRSCTEWLRQRVPCWARRSARISRLSQLAWTLSVPAHRLLAEACTGCAGMGLAWVACEQAGQRGMSSADTLQDECVSCCWQARWSSATRSRARLAWSFQGRWCTTTRPPPPSPRSSARASIQQPPRGSRWPAGEALASTCKVHPQHAPHRYTAPLNAWLVRCGAGLQLLRRHVRNRLRSRR